MKKQSITVSAEVQNVEQAKELLLEIEALSEKYVVHFEIKNYSLLVADWPQSDTTE